jgi:hypothetical protein
MSFLKPKYNVSQKVCISNSSSFVGEIKSINNNGTYTVEGKFNVNNEPMSLSREMNSIEKNHRVSPTKANDTLYNRRFKYSNTDLFTYILKPDMFKAY